MSLMNGLIDIKRNKMEEINSVIEDLEMLKDGTWVPDQHSCDASIEMLKRAKTKFDKMYSEEEVEKLLVKMVFDVRGIENNWNGVQIWFQKNKKK